MNRAWIGSMRQGKVSSDVLHLELVNYCSDCLKNIIYLNGKGQEFSASRENWLDWEIREHGTTLLQATRSVFFDMINCLNELRNIFKRFYPSFFKQLNKEVSEKIYLIRQAMVHLHNQGNNIDCSAEARLSFSIFCGEFMRYDNIRGVEETIKSPPNDTSICVGIYVLEALLWHYVLKLGNTLKLSGNLLKKKFYPRH